MIGEKRKLNDDNGAIGKENEYFEHNIMRQSIEIAKFSNNALLNGQAPVLTSYTDQVKSNGLAQRKEKETDPVKIKARLKQIQFGKNTKGYDNYLLLVPKDKRDSKNHIEHPKTPDPYTKYSKRAFDGLIQQWRRNLHKYDVPNTQTTNLTSNDIEEENIMNKKMRTENSVTENSSDDNSLVDYEEDAENIEYIKQKSSNKFFSSDGDDGDDGDDVL